MSTTITIRLEDEVKDRLDRLAESTQRSKSFLAAEAIREFVENNEWQIAEIRSALKEANDEPSRLLVIGCDVGGLLIEVAQGLAQPPNVHSPSTSLRVHRHRGR